MAPRKNTKTAKTTKIAVPKRITKSKTEEPAPKAIKPTKAVKAVTPLKKIQETTKVKSAKPAKSQMPIAEAPEPKPKKATQTPAAKTPVAATSTKQTDGLTPLAAAILAAIQEGRAVEFLFTDADANPPRTFEPRQLIFDTFAKAWFVWGWDRRYNAERHHRVDLLSEVNAVEGVGRSAQGPYKEGTPANQIGGWLGGEPIPVKAALLKQWIFAVKQAPAPFPEFHLEDSDEGKAIVSFTGTDLRAIARWCMQFGDGIQVLEPQRLIDRIKQVGALWVGKPKQEAPAKPVQAAPKPQPPAPRHEPRPESRPEPRHESRPEPRPESGRKPQRFEAPKEPETQKPKNTGRVEIRIDRL